MRHTGLSDAGLERLRKVAEQHVGETQVPGLVALVARGDRVHVEALGNLALGGPPVTRDSIFRIASTTNRSLQLRRSRWQARD